MPGSSTRKPLGRDELTSAVVAAVTARLGAIGTEELLRFITDRELASEVGTSPASLRRLFAKDGDGERMDRTRILRAVVEEAVGRLDEANRENARRWKEAAERIGAGAGPEALAEAVFADLGDFMPGGNEAINSRERIVGLALAVADSEDPRDRPLSRILASYYQGYGERYDDAFAALLHATGRELAWGATLADLEFAAHATLSHAYTLARTGTPVDSKTLLRNLARVWGGFTLPRPDAPRDLVAEILITGVDATRDARSADLSQ